MRSSRSQMGAPGPSKWPSARAGKSPDGGTPVMTASVLFPQRPLSTKQGAGGQDPRTSFRKARKSLSSTRSTSFLDHCFQAAHSLVEKTMKHCGTFARLGFELSTATQAKAPWPSTMAASQGIGSSWSKATIRFQHCEVLVRLSSLCRKLGVMEGWTILYPDLQPLKILFASKAKTTASNSPRSTSSTFSASSGRYRSCPKFASCLLQLTTHCPVAYFRPSTCAVRSMWTCRFGHWSARCRPMADMEGTPTTRLSTGKS
mmetsp:Transcript_133819/g.317159  ORF Transcript_133819/g.317159 Transcript_133819/m.317159 type:complete len:259 (+) Transcript_133819:346-1122(+)